MKEIPISESTWRKSLKFTIQGREEREKLRFFSLIYIDWRRLSIYSIFKEQGPFNEGLFEIDKTRVIEPREVLNYLACYASNLN